MNNRQDKFSRSMVETPPSGIRKFFEILIGHDDVISLSVGEPDFPTPWLMREEAFYHLEQGHTSYTSNWGLLELREQIAAYLERYDLYYNPRKEILVTVGASEGVDVTLRAILNPGDEIIVCQPCYVNYTPLAHLTGAKVVELDTSVNGFYPTAEQLEKACTPRCSPTTGFPPAPRPPVIACPIGIRFGAGDIFNACRSVFKTINSTSFTPTSIMRFTALEPPPPQPIIFITVGFAVSCESSAAAGVFSSSILSKSIINGKV